MPRNSRCARSGGFTLLEMLVVVVIVGLTGAIVLPRMTTVASSLDFALKREVFEQTLGALAYQAYRENADIILSGTYTEAGRSNEGIKPPSSESLLPANLRTRSLIETPREHLPPINPVFTGLSIPPGWQVTVAEPIYFRASGYCTGGDIDLQIGRAWYTYKLIPPLCHPILAE